jgi:hypothetical protein
LSEGCREKLFPITSGGLNKEMVSCTIFDEKNKNIIIVGNTTSPDYGPSLNSHAFAYAVDLNANWVWGKYFLNSS